MFDLIIYSVYSYKSVTTQNQEAVRAVRTHLAPLDKYYVPSTKRRKEKANLLRQLCLFGVIRSMFRGNRNDECGAAIAPDYRAECCRRAGSQQTQAVLHTTRGRDLFADPAREKMRKGTE